MPPITEVIQVAVQVLTTSLIGWLIHKLAMARFEFRQFMAEHDFLLKSAKDTSEAIVKLNKRFDRHVSRHG